MEELKSIIHELKHDVKEIKQIMVENTIKLADYNRELEIHIRASEDLHKRVVPLEHNAIFARKLVKLVAGIAALGGSVAGVLRLWLS